MASYNSILDQSVDYVAPYDLNILNKALATGQNRYDVGEKNYEDNLSQLKQKENLLARPEDRQRFSQNVQGLIDEINNKEGKGINWAKRGLTNKINGQINQALDNYTLDQIGVSQTIKSFNTEVAKKREKNDGSYSDTNYTDALELAGVQQYMQGVDANGNRVDKIGNLIYSNYVDVTSKMSKKAKEYSELMGKKKLLNTTTGEYETTDVFGEVVTMNDIYKTLSSELSPEDLNQLRINTRQSLGKLTKEDLAKTMNPMITEEITELKTETAALKAKMQTGSKEEKVKYASVISNNEDQIKEKQNSIDKQEYDIYGAYKDTTIKSIASNYDYEIITDINRDYGKLNIKKFEHDVMNDERNYIEKVKENSLKDKEVKALASPTEMDKPILPEDTKSAMDIINSEQIAASKKLDEMLIASNESEYRNMTTQEKFAYRQNMKISEIDTIERQNAIRDFQTTNKAFSKIVIKNTETLKSTTQNVFNSITGAKIDNLKNTAPYTVAAKKSGKKFEDLDKNVQKGIMLELGSNMLEFDGVDEQQRKVVKSSLNSLAGQLSNHPSENVKNIYKQVETSYKAIDSSNKERMFTGVAMGAGIAPITTINPKYLGRGFSFNQDNNITEIDEREDASINAPTAFKEAFDSMLSNTDKSAKIAEKNLISSKAFSFSTEDKGQKADAERLRQSILFAKETNDGIVAPTPNNNSFSVSKSGSGYEVAYMTGKSGEETMKRVYLERLPTEVATKFQSGEANWNTSLLNPNLITPVFNIKTQTPTEAYETVKNIYKVRPDVISPQDYVQIATKKSFFGTPFQTKEEYLDALEGQPEEKVKRAEYYLDANYEIKPEVENGILMGNVNITYPDGKKESIPFISKSKELDNTRLYMEGMQYVKALKDEKIYKIFK